MSAVLSAVKAVIQKEDKSFLLIKFIHPKITIWDLPGGRIKYNDSPLDTLLREVKEETFLDVNIERSLGVWWFFPPHLEETQIICHTYLCTPTGNEIKLNNNPADEKHIDYRWVTKQEFLNNPEYNNIEKSLKDLIHKLDIG